MKLLTVCLLLPGALFPQPGPPRGRQGAPAARQAQPTPVAPQDLCTVEGQVFNASTGEPLGKAIVMLRRAAPAPNPSRSYSGTSDPSGRFAITDIEPGKYRLSFFRNGFVDSDYSAGDLEAGLAFSLDAAKHMSGIILKMTPNGVIAGRIVDEDGEAMAGLQVEALLLRYSQGRKQLNPITSSTTNDIGEYRVFGLPPGRYYLSVSPRSLRFRGFARTSTRDSVEEYVTTYYPGATDPSSAAALDIAPGAQLRGTDLRLTKRLTVSVKGHVTNASGGDARRMMVMALPRTLMTTQSMTRPSPIDSSGNFEIRGLPAGPYVLIASIQERGKNLTSRMPVEVGNSNIDNVSLTINPALVVGGQVRIYGQIAAPPNLATVQVTLRPRDASAPMFSSNAAGKVAADGMFSIPNVNPNLYDIVLSGVPEGFYLKAANSAGQDALVPGLDLSRGAAGLLDIVLAPNAGQASGVVQNGQQPAPGVTVVLVPQEPHRKSQPQYFRTAVTDATGRFAFTSLDPGHYKVYTFLNVEPFAYMDPDFMRPFENRGDSLAISEGSQENLTLKLMN